MITENYNKRKKINIENIIKKEIIGAGLTIVDSSNETVIDSYFGKMKLINHIVALNNKTIEEMVSINMEIIDKHHLFSKQRIVFMLWHQNNSSEFDV